MLPTDLAREGFDDAQEEQRRAAADAQARAAYDAYLAGEYTPGDPVPAAPWTSEDDEWSATATAHPDDDARSRTLEELEAEIDAPSDEPLSVQDRIIKEHLAEMPRAERRAFVESFDPERGRRLFASSSESGGRSDRGTARLTLRRTRTRARCHRAPSTRRTQGTRAGPKQDDPPGEPPAAPTPLLAGGMTPERVHLMLWLADFQAEQGRPVDFDCIRRLFSMMAPGWTPDERRVFLEYILPERHRETLTSEIVAPPEVVRSPRHGQLRHVSHALTAYLREIGGAG